MKKFVFGGLALVTIASVQAETELQKIMTPLNKIAKLSVQYHNDCNRYYTVKYATHRVKQKNDHMAEHEVQSIKALQDNENKRNVHKQSFVENCVQQAISRDDVYQQMLQVQKFKQQESAKYETSQW